MHEPLTRLRKELAKTIVEVKNKNQIDTFTQEQTIQFTFNGFSAFNLYKEFLITLYDEFKTELEVYLRITTLQSDRIILLESIRLNIIECEKLYHIPTIDEFNFEFLISDFQGVRLEADVKVLLGKK